MTRPSLLAISLALATLTACGAPPNRTRDFHVTLRAESDPGQPLGGVAVELGGSPAGVTDASGTMQVMITAVPGTPMNIRVQCPEGTRAPEAIPPLVLTAVSGLDGSERELEVGLRCEPTRRTAAILVRGAGAAGVPVLVGGRELARTDESGAAHVILDATPSTDLTVTLDTSARPELVPRSPTRTFTVASADRVFLFDQPFEAERVERRRRRRAEPEPTPEIAPPPPEPETSSLPVRITGT